MNLVWIFLQVVLSISFWFPILLMVIAAFRNKFKNSNGSHSRNYDYAVIVTAYQQTDLIPDVVSSILKTSYDNYMVYVVADDCDTSTLNFNDDRIIVLRPAQVLASNTKSHFYAIEHFKREHDVITIIDSDNLVHKNYFTGMNAMFDKGYLAVQGVRAARNLDTIYARLDEAGDIFYRYIDRRLLYRAGSSASLAGSSMAFLTGTYIQSLQSFNKSGAGFDKVLQFELVNNKNVIAFTEDSIVYDAKTSKSDQLVKQRARWINTWFKYWMLAVKLFFKAIINFNWNQFAFSIMLLRPPLFILFFVSALMMVINLFMMPVMAVYWVVMFGMFLITFLTALSHFKADTSIYDSLLQAPRFVFYQVIALFKAKKANKLSVATRHETSTYKSDL